jgi:2-alkyl-3-oxoalkanoate reductase
MTSLVTGAAGFLGSYVLKSILADKQCARGLVRSEEQAAALRSQGAEAAVGDVRDAAAVAAAVQGADVVYHCAAAVGAKYSHHDVWDINLGGTRNVLDALKAAGRGRLVLVSSLNVLGIRNFDNATEEFAYRRANESHGDVKIAAEQMALEYHQRHGVEVTIVRPALIYGAGERNIPKLLDTIRRGKFAFIGSRDNVIPMLHVSDVVQALRLAAASPQAVGRIYQVTDGQRTTAGEFIGYLAELIDCPPPQKVLPYAIPYAACLVFEWLNRLHITSKPGPINRVGLRFLGTSRSVDITRARQELGYAPRVAFRAGMAATVQDILKEGTKDHVAGH